MAPERPEDIPWPPSPSAWSAGASCRGAAQPVVRLAACDVVTNLSVLTVVDALGTTVATALVLALDLDSVDHA